MSKKTDTQDGPKWAKSDLVEQYSEVYSKPNQTAEQRVPIEAVFASQQEVYREMLTTAISSLDRERNTLACSSTHIEVDPELLTKKELAKRMKVCERTIEVLCNDSKIPRIVFGRNVRFRWRDVLSALESYEVEAGCLISDGEGNQA